MRRIRSLAFFVAVYSYFTIGISSTGWVDTLPSFLEADDLPLQGLVVHKETGDVYVAGRNVLYHLSSDLNVKQKVSTGPALDHPDCLHPSYPCHHKKFMTDNDNKFLDITNYMGSPMLMLCGTLYGTLCQVRPVDDITRHSWIGPYNESIGFNVGPVFNTGLFAPGYGGQLSLFMAATHDPDKRKPYSAPFLSSKVLVKNEDQFVFQYSYQNGTKFSAINFEGSSTRYAVDGFIHEKFAYFLVVHVTGRGVLGSRLVRVCTADGTFNSYAELPIACNKTGDVFPWISDAVVGDASPKLKRDHHLAQTEKLLYASFIKKSLKESVVCIFPMSSVIAAFNAAPRTCFGEDSITGVPCHQEDKPEIEEDDLCSSSNNPYVVDQPFVSSMILTYFPKTSISALTVVQQNGQAVAIVGSREGYVIKINLDTGFWISQNDLLDANQVATVSHRLSFDLSRENIYFVVKNKVVKFPVGSCSTHEDCSLCLLRGTFNALHCGWCNGRCAHRQECPDLNSFSNDTCSPLISEVTPLRGAMKGGTSVTIGGDNFGSYIDETHNSISVAGSPCKTVSWKNTEVVCTTSSSHLEVSGPLQLSVTNPFQSQRGFHIAGSATSAHNFTYYQGPRLYGIFPDKGPTSGGTHVMLFGDNLDMGTQRVLNIRGRRCTLKGFNKTLAWCVTRNATSLEFPDSIAIHVDTVAFEMEANPPSTFNLTGTKQSFVYLPDPEVHHIYPGITTLSGLMNVIVTGVRLDTVGQPSMTVEVSLPQTEEKLEFTESCWSKPESQGTVMMCRTPDLKRPGIPVPTRTLPLLTHVAFNMDGVQKLKELPKHQEIMSRLLYYPDPELEPFRELKRVPDTQNTLEIKGRYLDLIQSPDNLHVIVGGNEMCKISALYASSLRCDLPSNLMSNSSLYGTNVSVEVAVGFSKLYLGNIEILEPESKTSVWNIVALVVIALGFLFSFGIVFRCYYMARKKSSFDCYTMPTRNEAGNDYIPVPTTTLITTGHPVSQVIACNTNVPVPETSASKSNAPVPETSASASNAPVPGVTAIKTYRPVSASHSQERQLVDRETMRLMTVEGLVILKHFLDMGKQIGAGEFGRVYEGYLQRVNDPKPIKVAIKALHNIPPSKAVEEVASFLQEAFLMKDFHHQNVLRLIGVTFDGPWPLVILPFMEHGDLCKYIRDKERRIMVAELLLFALNVATGMTYLAEKKFVHRDLATRNCVLDSKMVAKVADFGLSRDIYQAEYYSSGNRKAKIPIKWLPPESLEKSRYTEKTDVWSYGVLLWELMTRGTTPYEEVLNGGMLTYLKSGGRLAQPQYCSNDLYIVMLACWNKDPDNRPCFYQLEAKIRQQRKELLTDRNTRAQQHTVAQNTVYMSSLETGYTRMDEVVMSHDV